VSVQRRPVLRTSTRERHNGYRASRPQHASEYCGHKLLSVIPVVSLRVEGGYVGRCLLCGMTGPVRANGLAARLVLLEQMVGA
jgi:hypothetical protein